MEECTRVDNFIENWNGTVPDYPLTIVDLKKPHAVMGALFQIFDRLEIDRDAILMPPPEESRSENTAYFWDLLPVFNVVRVINHFVSIMPQVNISIKITHLLQPTVTRSHSILLLMSNLVLFNKQKLSEIEPHEEELFSKTEQVKSLEDRKNRLLEMLNEQAEEKGKRAERLEKIDYEVKQHEEELKQLNEAVDVEKQEVEVILKENRQTEIDLEQKKTQRDTVLAEIKKKQALRVYDAEDIKAQAEQAALNVQEAEEKLNSLRSTLMQKEDSLKNLQTIKPILDTANNLLHDIMKQSEILKDYESGDLDLDSKEGELDVLNTELSELEVQFAELKVAREEASKKRQKSHAKRQQERTLAQSNLRETEEKEKKNNERSRKASQRVQKIKDLTTQYEHQKAKGLEELNEIKNIFTINLKSTEEALLKKALESKERIEDKLRNRKI